MGEVVWEGLQRLVRELRDRKAGGHLLGGSLRDLDLHLRLALRGPEADPRVFTEELIRSIDRILDDAVHHAASFRPGRAFCHRCDSAACAHSLPPSSRHVFVGYAPTGMPRWEDFAQFCLERRLPEVDRLYQSPPAFLTVLESGASLRRRLLDAFRIRSYQLVGQLAAGFFQIRAREGEGRGVLALTFQVAASHAQSGHLRLGLNILGRSPQGGDLEELWELHPDLPWRRAVRWAQAALVSVSDGTRAGRGGRASAPSPARVDARVEGILRGLARRLEREHRSRSRRTHHAEVRHESGRRPTRKAMEDARAAGAGDVLVDQRSGTLVVLGDRGRTHFFTEEGRLVSSVRYGRDAIERKRKLGLWRPASNLEVSSLRRRLPGQD